MQVATIEEKRMININISDPKKLPGLISAFIYFDVYNEELINRIREMDNRVYNSENKTWEIPINNLESFISSARNFDIQITLENHKQRKINLPKGFEFKTKPYSYQLEGVEYGLNHNMFILGDEQGLGKTKQLIDIVVARKLRNEVKQCLVIVGVNSIKYNWLDEIKIHSNESGWVLGTKFRKNGKRYEGGTVDKIEDLKNRKETFLITNVETLRNDEFVDELKKSKTIDMIAVDEAHLMRNPQSHQGKNLIKLQNIKYKIAMTGTLLVNSPLDSYSILKWLGIEKSNFTTFKKYYCNFGGFGGYQITGFKHLDVLRESIQKNMLRRLKKDVLDLPEKTETIEYVEMSNNQWKIYDDIRNEILDNIDLITLSPNPLTELLRLRQCTGWTGLLSSEIRESTKMDRLVQLVEDITSNGHKVIVYSNWTSTTDVIREKLKNYNPAFITGQLGTVERQEQKDMFQNDKSCKVCVGTIGAMSTGLTLTAANYAIFYDLPWHKAAYDQASDRIHRIGQNDNVTIIKLICKDTIDERIQEIIYNKGAISDMLVDGKISRISKNDILKFIE